MPIVTLTENKKTRYHAVSEGCEIRLTAVVEEYGISDHGSREYAEHALKREYLKQLSEHAHDCMLLAHLVRNPPEDDGTAAHTKLAANLVDRVETRAMWLRTYEPFAALCAEVSEGKGCTTVLIGDEHVSTLYDQSWEASQHAMWESDPWRRDHYASIEQEKAEKEAANKLPPDLGKRLKRVATKYIGATNAIYDERDRRKARAARAAKRSSKRRAS